MNEKFDVRGLDLAQNDAFMASDEIKDSIASEINTTVSNIEKNAKHVVIELVIDDIKKQLIGMIDSLNSTQDSIGICVRAELSDVLDLCLSHVLKSVISVSGVTIVTSEKNVVITTNTTLKRCEMFNIDYERGLTNILFEFNNSYVDGKF